MSDFKVSALFETNAPQVERDVGRVADSLDRVGTSATAASRGTDALATASGKLAKARADVAIADERVAKMQDRTDASRPKVIANANEYTRALNEQLKARLALAHAIKDGQTAQAKADTQAARSPAASGTSTKSIAAGVGIGVAAEQAAAYLADKARVFVTGSIEQASKLSETITNNGRVFGGYAEQVDQFGKSAATSLGLSRQAAIETADSFGALFHGVGIEGSQSSGLATGLTKLGVDLAAFKQEADPGQAFHALEQALSGQYDALHQYDIVLTTATVRDEAFRLGLIRTRTDALTPQATAIAAASLATEKAAVQTGAFSRSTDDLAGKQKVLSANIKNAQADLGKGLLPAMSGLADIANGTLIPALSGVGKAIEFVGEHSLTRHLAELALLMYGAKVSVNLLTLAYDKLAFSAGRAAVAETAAAEAPTSARGPGLIPKVGGLGAKTAIGATLAAVGGLVYEGFQGDERHRLLEGARARGQSIGLGRDFSRPYEQGVVHLVGKALSAVGAGSAGSALDRATGYSYDMAAYARAQQAEAERAKNAARWQSQGYGPAFSAALTTQDRAQQRRATADFNVRSARAYLDSRSFVKDAGSIPLGGLFDALPDKPDQSVVQNARDEQRAANAALAIARARVAKTRAGSGGAGAGQIASAEAAVLTAQDALRRRGGNAAAEQLRLQAAESHLAQLRQGGKTDTVALMTAENGLETARTRQRKAAEALHKAEKEASGDKSLTLQEVLARASHAAGTSTTEVGNVRKLVKAGVSEPVIAELEQLEQTAPGTMARVAKGITPAFVKQLNADQAARDKAAIDLAKLGGQAKLKAAQDEAAKSGKSLGDALAASLVAALKDPVWQAAARTALGGLLLPGADGSTGAGGKTGTTTSASGYLDSLFGLPPGVAAGITVPPQVVPGPAPAPAAPPHGVAPVALHLTPVRSQVIRGIVEPDIARAQRQAALVIGRQG